MENFNKSPSGLNRIEQARDFGRFLSRLHFNSNKKTGEVAPLFGVSASSLTRWFDGTAFPEEEKLPIIAEVYGIKLAELTKVFESSKAARGGEKDVRKTVQYKGRGM